MYLQENFRVLGSLDCLHHLPDPFDDIVVRVVQLRLEYFQVSHFETRWGEGNLKVHGYWRPCPLLFGVGCQKLNLGRYLRFLHSPHPLDLPHDGVLARLVLGLALHADQLDTTCVEWCGDSRKEKDENKLPR